MDKYYLFAGAFYYPAGGILDYVTTVENNTLEGAVSFAKEILEREDKFGEWYWWHLVSASTLSVVAENDVTTWS